MSEYVSEKDTPRNASISDEYEVLEKTDTNLNNFGRVHGLVEKSVIGLSTAIEDTFFTVKSIEEKHNTMTNDPEIKGRDFSSNFWYKLYTEQQASMNQLKIAHAYRMWWVRFLARFNRKLIELLESVKEDYDGVAKIKAEKELYETRHSKDTEALKTQVAEIERVYKEREKHLEDALKTEKEEKKFILQMVAKIKTGESSMPAETNGHSHSHKIKKKETTAEEDLVEDETDTPEVEEAETVAPHIEFVSKYTEEEMQTDREKMLEVVSDAIAAGITSRKRLFEVSGMKLHPLKGAKLTNALKTLKYRKQIDENFKPGAD